MLLENWPQWESIISIILLIILLWLLSFEIRLLIDIHKDNKWRKSKGL